METKIKTMEQLQLTESELLEIGFKKNKSISDEMNEERVFFKIPTLNGYFYYNQNENKYTWYHKTIIGEVANDVHLDISKKPELFILLSCFNVKFNLIF